MQGLFICVVGLVLDDEVSLWYGSVYHTVLLGMVDWVCKLISHWPHSVTCGAQIGVPSLSGMYVSRAVQSDFFFL